MLVYKEPPRERKTLKIFHFFNHFPYRVYWIKEKVLVLFQYHFTLLSSIPMLHFYIFYLFKDPLRTVFTHSYSFIFVTCNYQSGHFLACAYSCSTPLSFFPPRRSVTLFILGTLGCTICRKIKDRVISI